QLEPHFIRNTLNAISALVTAEPAEARRLLAVFGELLGELQQDHEALRPLSDELAWMRRYGELLESRYGPQLHIDWQIATGATTGRLPSLLLQPLLENAVVHGALARPEGGRVTVVVERLAASVRVTIRDNGPGMSGERRPGARGLAMVEDTLKARLPK